MLQRIALRPLVGGIVFSGSSCGGDPQEPPIIGTLLLSATTSGTFANPNSNSSSITEWGLTSIAPACGRRGGRS